MTPIDRFERHLPDGLTDLAAERMPDYVDDLLARTARRRQRPAWTLPERWLPMTITLRRPMLALPLGLLAIGLAMLLALVTVATVIPLLSQPAIVARTPVNGPIVFNPDDKHFHLIDPVTGEGSLFKRGDPAIRRPTWSPDGTRLAYLAGYPDGPSEVWVTELGTDGSPAVSDRYPDLKLLRWAPDGSRLLVVSQNGGSGAITLLPVDVSDAMAAETLDLGLAVEWADWAPDGTSLLFKGTANGQPKLYSLPLDGPPTPHEILSVDTSMPLFGEWPPSEFLWDPTFAPAGSTILYSTVVDRLPTMAPGTQNARARLVDPDGSNDRLLEVFPDSNYEIAWGWAPDSTRVAIRVERGGDVLLALAPVDDPTASIVVGPDASIGRGAAWSPDSTMILTWGDDGSAAFIDAATGALTPISSRIMGDSVSWRPLFP